MQRYRVRIREKAFEDLQDIVNYYNSKQHGLGKRFFSLFEHTLEILQINPYFQVRFDSVRSLPLHSFPYNIYFDVDPQKNIVNIYAVLHQAMDPNKINERFE